MQANDEENSDAIGDESLAELGVSEAAAAIRNGDISAERYASSLLSRARGHDDLNAFVTIDEAAVLSAARDADKRRAAGENAPLLGVPIGIKDSYLTQGLRTTFGLDAFEFVPDEDAASVREIRRAGGIVFGKTNLVSMSWGLTGKDSRGGQVKNPRNPARVAGGSSSGAAAAVGAGLIPASLGGDTIGSIRVPASLSGGVVPVSHTLDTTGVLGRSVADCRLIDSVVTAADTEHRGGSLRLPGLRFAVAPRQYLDLVAPEVQGRFDEIVRRLRAAGAEIIEVDLGDDFTSIARVATWNIFFHDTLGSIARFLLEQRVPLTFDAVHRHLGPDLRGAWEYLVLPDAPGAIAPDVYQSAVSTHRSEVHRRLQHAFEDSGAQALLFPTTPCTAPLIEQQSAFSIAGRDADHLVLANNTIPGSLAGLPGISLPAGRPLDGMPFGLELDGKPGDDRQLLEIAGLVEPIIGA
ncbi:MAG: amidase family protein [Burkholderia sp.]